MKPRAKDWDKMYRQGKHFTPVDNKLVGRFLRFSEKRFGAKIKNVIDLGCGTGDFAIKLAKRGRRVVCMDFSSVALKIAREHGRKNRMSPKIKFIKHDMEKLEKFKPLAGFDLAINRLTFAFLQNKKKFLSSVKALLKPGGIFVLMTPVLFPRLNYSKHIKTISLKKAEVERLLKGEFKKYVIFHKRPFGEHGLEITYIAHKKWLL